MNCIFLDSSDKINKNCIPINLNNILKAMIREVLPRVNSSFKKYKLRIYNNLLKVNVYIVLKLTWYIINVLNISMYIIYIKKTFNFYIINIFQQLKVEFKVIKY